MGHDAIFFNGVRKARKQHKCANCSTAIEGKSEYWYTSGVWDGKIYQRKACVPCGEVIEALFDYHRRHGEHGTEFDLESGSNKTGEFIDDDGRRYTHNGDCILIFDDERELIDD